MKLQINGKKEKLDEGVEIIGYDVVALYPKLKLE
jgi:hypothetical protein